MRMEGIAKLACVSLFIQFVALGQIAPTPVADPGELLQRAKLLLSPNGKAIDNGAILLQVIPLLRQANAIWERSTGNEPQYAESLDLLAILLRSTERNNEPWQKEAAPLVSRALEIREAQSETQPSADLALALELQADVFGHEDAGASAGAPFWSRAVKIRSQLVARTERLVRSADPEPSVSVLRLPPADIAERVSKADGVSPPSVISKVDPRYSEIARIARYSCTVRFSIVVDAQGSARNLTLVHGCGYDLDENAAASVLQWRFQPGMKNEQPVNVRAAIDVNFKLL